jgi:hypothetical protein
MSAGTRVELADLVNISPPDLTMPPIPVVVTLLNSMDRDAYILLLKAAVLRLQQDDGGEGELIITDRDIQAARSYSLVTTTIDEERAVVLSVRQR